LPKSRPATFDQTHPRSRRLGGAFVGVVLVLAGLLVGGCGSSSSSSSSSTAAAKPALSKAQFIAQGNAICTQGNKNLAAAEKQLGSNPTEAQFAAFLGGPFKSEVQRQITALRALGAPAGDSGTVSHILGLAQSDLDRVSADPKSFVTAKTSPFKDFSTAAHAYGLTVCAEEN
jgi:hypothetical protein